MKSGEKLPSVREFSEQISVNPNTVQRAYQELEREGVTETKRGMGTFITAEQEKVTEIRTLFAEHMIATFMQTMKAGGFCIHEIVELISTYEKKHTQQ